MRPSSGMSSEGSEGTERRTDYKSAGDYCWYIVIRSGAYPTCYPDSTVSGYKSLEVPDSGYLDKISPPWNAPWYVP